MLKDDKYQLLNETESIELWNKEYPDTPFAYNHPSVMEHTATSLPRNTPAGLRVPKAVGLLYGELLKDKNWISELKGIEFNDDMLKHLAVQYERFLYLVCCHPSIHYTN